MMITSLTKFGWRVTRIPKRANKIYLRGDLNSHPSSNSAMMMVMIMLRMVMNMIMTKMMVVMTKMMMPPLVVKLSFPHYPIAST